MERSEIGYCVTVLSRKLWGKILVNGRLRSQNWWRQKLESEINLPTIVISSENLWECRTAEPAPIPFEQEMGWTEDTAEYWLEWLQKAFAA